MPFTTQEWKDSTRKTFLPRTRSGALAELDGAILTNTMLPDICREFLAQMIRGEALERVAVSVAESERLSA